jgi:hypothetical protein
MGHDMCLGPFGLNDPLPNFERCGTAYQVCMRALADSVLPGDPAITAEAGADRDAYLAEFLNFSTEDFTRAVLLTAIQKKIEARK